MFSRRLLSTVGSVYHIAAYSSIWHFTQGLSRTNSNLQCHYTQCRSSSPHHTTAIQTAIHRSPSSDRQGCDLRTSRPFHERHPRDTSMWILKSKCTDTRSAGRGPKQVCGFQCAGGYGVEERYVSSNYRTASI